MKYILQSANGLVIDGETELNIGIKRYLNELCIKNGSTYMGRIESVKRLHNRKKEVPLYICENCILVYVGSIRNYCTVFLNFSRILSYSKTEEDKVFVIFDDLTTLYVDVSYNRFRTQNNLAKSLSF